MEQMKAKKPRAPGAGRPAKVSDGGPCAPCTLSLDATTREFLQSQYENMSAGVRALVRDEINRLRKRPV